MTIRFTCAECASVLKIKDELAGSTGRCPKCKTKFVVPDPPSDKISPQREIADRQVVDSKAVSSTPEDSTSESNREQTTAPADVEDSIRQPANTSLHAEKESEPESTALPQAPIAVTTPVVTQPDEFPRSTSELAQKNNSSEPQSDASDPFHLSLEDSDDSVDEVKPPSVSDPRNSDAEISHAEISDAEISHAEISDAEIRHTDSAEHSFPSIGAADDLDSPPMLVSSVYAQIKMPAESLEAKKGDFPRASAENSVKSSKSSSPAKREEAFDPLKFLMDDVPAQKPISFSTKAENDSDLSLSDDSDYEIPSRPTPQPMTRSTPVAPSSRSVPEKVDLATAAKMMKKAIKDSQADAAKQRESEASSGFDYTQFFREFGMRGLAILAAAVVFPLGLYFGFDYMLSSKFKLPKLGYVSGTVKLDGKPLEGALVYFAPNDAVIEGTKKEKARTSVGVTDKTGFYKMKYVEHIEGVAAGKCRVWLSHIGEKGNDIPNEWLELAMHPAEVTIGNQKAPFDINMESKKSDPKKK